MNDNHNPHYEKSTQAHKAAIAAEKRFDADPTPENAFEAYRLSREAMRTGGLPYGDESSTYVVGNKTLNVRKEFMASTPKGHAGPDVVTIEINGSRLMKLCNALEHYLEMYYPYSAQSRDELDGYVQLIRDIRAESLRITPTKD
jgi:hypothetical protein